MKPKGTGLAVMGSVFLSLRVKTIRMPQTNFDRMIQLAEDVFATRNDPSQLAVDDAVLKHLQQLHPASVAEESDAQGPIAWVLVIPTTHELMNKFLEGKLSEMELYHQTPLKAIYDAIYLCSALVLQEHRRKGITKQLTVKAIRAIQQDHPIASLFVWTFTEQGWLAAESIARAVQLPLFVRTERKD